MSKKRIELDTEKPADETPSKKDIDKARELAREISPLMAGMYDAEEKKS